jgi:hypothetical protein
MGTSPHQERQKRAARRRLALYRARQAAYRAAAGNPDSFREIMLDHLARAMKCTALCCLAAAAIVLADVAGRLCCL